jgi:hypothetical protein
MTLCLGGHLAACETCITGPCVYAAAPLAQRRGKMIMGTRTMPRLAPSLRNISLSLLLLGTLALSGCDTIRVHLGMRVELSKLPVTSMEASLPQGSAIAPGEQSPLVVTFTQPDGKILETEGAGKGKVLWSDLTVTPTVVTLKKKGVLYLAHDPRLSQGKTGHVEITVPSHPGLEAQLDIPLRYDYPFVASYAGASGSDGINGTDGTNGMSGSDGSMDPNSPSAGGDGGNGTDGTNGGDGSDGSNGPVVQVFATLQAGSATPLLQFRVIATGHRDHFYLVDPNGGSLTIDSFGGRGGSGGKGGKGGSGGNGGSGTPPGSGGQSGQDGRNGQDGSDGRGGPITVTYDPRLQPYLSLIHVSNPGGLKPAFVEQVVAPLW